ncbi:MAG: DUF3597 domain-containing protein [Chloroflexota bacterium]
MGLFSKILTKLGIKKAETATTPTPNVAAMPQPAVPAAKPAAPAAPVTPAPSFSAKAEMDQAQQHMYVSQSPAAPAAPAPISEVDVVKHLEQLAAEKKGLDWKISIVDLLKLLDLESSFEARKEMAVELGCPAELMGDSAKMNTWLHKEVLRQIAHNGGNIPKDLLD